MTKKDRKQCGPSQFHRMKERIARLYEQGADAVSIGQYVQQCDLPPEN